MNPIRAFIAVEINEEIRKTINEMQERLKECNCDVKWVKPENIHLTLKFLGDVELDKIDQIKTILNGLVEKINTFEIKFQKLGAFPGTKRPKTIWIGSNDKNSELQALVASLEENMEKTGFKKENRDFWPHLTLGRVRSQKNIAVLADKLFTHAIEEITIKVDHIVLIKSTLTPKGPIYEKLNS